MVAITLPALHTSDPIRQLDLTRDLDSVADLIELCFPIHSDPDGKLYVNEMRKAAREMRLMGWLAGISDQYPTKSSGFVWEEDGHIVGNLSLIPLQTEGRQVYLIANVAVHPDHRRRGIARKLTQRALNDLRQRKISQVWLQVRDDNPPAVNLYRSLGFCEKAIRTTWRIRPRDFLSPNLQPNEHLAIRRWVRRDWASQRAWLEEAYPPAVHWNLPLNFRRFTPGFLQYFSNYLEGASLKHWSVMVAGVLQGVITWQKSDSYANNLWLAFPMDREADLLPIGLAYVLTRLPKNHPLSIDYPKGRCAAQLLSLGFEEFRTLIWMEQRL